MDNDLDVILGKLDVFIDCLKDEIKTSMKHVDSLSIMVYSTGVDNKHILDDVYYHLSDAKNLIHTLDRNLKNKLGIY